MSEKDTRSCVECGGGIESNGYHLVNVETDEYVAGPYCSIKCRSVDASTNQ